LSRSWKRVQSRLSVRPSAASSRRDGVILEFSPDSPNTSNKKEQAMWLRMSVFAAMLLGSPAIAVQAQEAAPSNEARIESMKQALVASKATLKQYEWIETMALSLSGEEKVKQQNTCYYGADGALQKVPVAADAKEDKKRGLRGKVADSKKEEFGAAIKSATALIHQYSPLDPAKLQAAKAAGNVSVSVPGADGMVRVTIKNYLKPGDEVGIVADAAKNTLKSVSISSFVEDGKTKNPVAASVTYAALADGTPYPAKESMEISAQKLKIDIQNSGYRKHGP